jgi:hypothetical protein|tara:strand:+ start:114 stop:386 length:273 start_codon:yes stop_codon:yes gene_type:complete
MDELMDMIVSDESPAQISDKLKDMLYAKSAEKVETARPIVANSLFGDQELEDEIDDEEVDEVDAESELEVEAEAETEIEDDAQQSTAQVY